MKLFLAIPASDLNVDLKKLKVGLDKGKNFQHKWIPQEHWHIPLCALNEINEEALRSLLKNQRPFVLKLEGINAYPEVAHARLLWIGVQSSVELRELQKNLLLEFAASPENEEETFFRPNLPIVRLKNHRQVSDVISPYKKTHFGKFEVKEVAVYEMNSGGAFPTYKKQTSFSLG